MSRRVCCMLAVVGAIAGCSGFIANQAASTTYGILRQGFTAARRQPDLELARAAMPGGIFQLASFALAYPDHREFKTLYAETLCQYTVAFVFDDWEAAQLADRDDDARQLAGRLATLTGSCVDANLAVLPPAWTDARRRGGAAWTRAIAGATADQTPALRWIATADAVVLATDPMRHVTELGAIIDALARCAQLAPGAHDADAELLLATLAAARGQIFGGGDGHVEFARARQLAGDGALIVDVMFARGVAVARHDRALFEATLQRVLAADVTRWPDRRLGNELARVKARRYLAAAARLVP